MQHMIMACFLISRATLLSLACQQDAASMYKAVHGRAIPTLAGGRKLVCAFKVCCLAGPVPPHSCQYL